MVPVFDDILIFLGSLFDLFDRSCFGLNFSDDLLLFLCVIFLGFLSCLLVSDNFLLLLPVPRNHRGLLVGGVFSLLVLDVFGPDEPCSDHLFATSLGLLELLLLLFRHVLALVLEFLDLVLLGLLLDFLLGLDSILFLLALPLFFLFLLADLLFFRLDAVLFELLQTLLLLNGFSDCATASCCSLLSLLSLPASFLITVVLTSLNSIFSC